MPTPVEMKLQPLTDGDKHRIIACYLSIPDVKKHVKWDEAATLYGSASVESMKVSMNNVLKKMPVDDTSGDPNGSPTAATPKQAAGRKRKTTTEESPASAGAGTPEDTPSKKENVTKGRGKKAKVEPADPEDEMSDTIEVKAKVQSTGD